MEDGKAHAAMPERAEQRMRGAGGEQRSLGDQQCRQAFFKPYRLMYLVAGGAGGVSQAYNGAGERQLLLTQV
jgi:hypothetical protein